jgi:hypothetical protein
MNTTATAKSNNDPLDSLFHISMLSGPLPPLVNVTSRFQTDLAQTDWYFEENGFNPVQASYNSSGGVGDGNTRPLVSRAWLKENHETNKTLTIYSTDPRGVVSHTSGQIDIFRHRRNNSTHAWWDKKSDRDWWKEVEDLSTGRSSVWLSLDLPEKIIVPNTIPHGRSRLDLPTT